MTNYSRGREREYRSMALLETAGYDAFRSAGSHGAWDVVGVSDTGIVLVQCKLGIYPTKAEVERMQESRCPRNGLKLLHYYTKGRHLPEVYRVDELVGA